MQQNSEEGIKELEQLLQQEKVETAVRVGDIYSLLIQFFASKQRWKQAHGLFQEMREQLGDASIRYYLSAGLIEAMHRELGIEYKALATARSTYNNNNNVNNNMNANDDDDIKDNVDYGTYDD